jgi:hypothetical protein
VQLLLITIIDHRFSFFCLRIDEAKCTLSDDSFILVARDGSLSILIFEALFVFEFFDDVFDDGLTFTRIIDSEILGQPMPKCFDLNLEKT